VLLVLSSQTNPDPDYTRTQIVAVVLRVSVGDGRPKKRVGQKTSSNTSAAIVASQHNVRNAIAQHQRIIFEKSFVPLRLKLIVFY
jgi:hypothetical protein